MRIGIISDIHGNLPALEVVLEKLKDLKADTICCLGDTVGYGAFPNECLARVQETCDVVLKGNHDSGLIGETALTDFNQYGVQAILWSQKIVNEKNVSYLKSLPFSKEKHGLMFAHASPAVPEDWTYVLTVRAAKEAFTAFSTDLCFIGHTHVPVVIGEDASINTYQPGERFIINVGSVGQPRDGNPNSAFGLYDTDTGAYELTRVPYDIERTAKAIEGVGLPKFLALRLFQGI